MENKIVVIDDDPTGSQTVHSCLLLTKWTPETLEVGLTDPAPLFFVLSNTRSLGPAAAREVIREICRNLKQALGQHQLNTLFVSRSDSTLRGHYPVESDVISEELGPFDAHFLVPAFFEGGRVTIEGVHYIKDGEDLVRTDTTEYARDSLFAYSTSYLPEYVEEKTHGRIKAADVVRLPILTSVDQYVERITELEDNRCVAVDSTSYDELRIFAQALLKAVANGKRFYLRSAASIVSALAALPPQPVDPAEMWRMRRSDGPGAVVVGSHVRRSTEQLNTLLHEAGIAGIELDVNLLPEGMQACIENITNAVSQAHADGKTAVVYTSRSERAFPTSEGRLHFGESVSEVLVAIVRELPSSTSFLISKGGITSNDVLSRGLDIDICRVIGQIIPGCTVVAAPDDHRLANLPVVIFPGNVGGPESLVEVYHTLTKGRSL